MPPKKQSVSEELKKSDKKQIKKTDVPVQTKLFVKAPD